MSAPKLKPVHRRHLATGAAGGTSTTDLSVPDLTPIAPINLNKRVVLRFGAIAVNQGRPKSAFRHGCATRGREHGPGGDSYRPNKQVEYAIERI
jgi:hypothetical protein